MMDNYFPTEFAISIAKDVGLYPLKPLYDYDGKKAILMKKKHGRLKEFQQIAALYDYEKAISIYKDIEVDEEKESALKIIAEITPLQLSGATVESMIEIITTNKNHKDYAKLTDILMTQLHGEKGEGGLPEAFEALVIKTTKRE